ncbi:trypsin-like peptidase domain-containing protein [Streptomyces bacillaris]|uniref:PDZ domain-containing protein n=1 Tax=Streptomyces cavourensis TaxID=67258 RepID=A0AAD0Q7N4_9ACTN|nr:MULTISPECIES: trypsin-like peptidase domain-containing protein [Streptomyces]AXI73800.1 PDZ domain-containing protein [Streptomyces cavourensis]NUV41560.1 PDZ domain-containing protein [Streptomyces sp. CAI-24]NUV81870.1 PDZ domain-containing protein [Streptomyces sp. CAI-155]UTR78129.1 trypsin-like peptidase domain-containing protein [Streptomyces cavourensis]WAE68397.1 trypsin-like peptidase domain-containing protein [Streptomyces cavourensis]
MDDGKPTGPQAKWWSRPTTGRPGRAEPEESRSPGEDTPPAPPGASDPAARGSAADPSHPTASAPDHPAAPADAAQPGAGREPQASHRPRPSGAPLHEPDAYSTPPYGDPGPWAPAPPVQRPTPAHGTPVPPQAAAPSPQHPSPVPPPTGVQPQPAPVQPQPQPHPTAVQQQPVPVPAQWGQYDPWAAPGQPLTQLGPPAGTEPGRRKKRRGGAFAGVLLLTLVASGIGGGVGAYIERNGGLTTVELPQASRTTTDRAPDSVAGIAASALPSVVTLHVSGTAESGTGTGFVLDDRGHILTNNHVVAPAGATGDITVTFSSGETATAELVGKDSGYDLAVVKVRGVSGLKPLPLGNSDNVQVGDPVVAIGAPFDLSNTVTSGIISAKQRPITAGGEKGDGSDISYVDALQTDAPINPGNSGGPLVDTQAHVIGINSAIRAADSGKGPERGGQSGSIGLGFAIPINQGKRVAEELINTGRATHPVIGVTLDMKFTGDGAKVGTKGADDGPAVTKDGPAAKAGIKSGDVITAVQGQRVHSGEELIVKIRAHRPGDRLELRLTRGGEELTITLTLGSSSGT